MLIQELGSEIRRARQTQRLTQAQLAAQVGLSRNTLNRLENGLFPDLGIKKAGAILEHLGMELAIRPLAPKRKSPDFVSMACTSSSVSFREILKPEELIHALLSGKAPPRRMPHFRVLLEEAPLPLLKGLVEQVGAWVKPGKVERNLAKIARQAGLTAEECARRMIAQGGSR